MKKSFLTRMMVFGVSAALVLSANGFVYAEGDPLTESSAETTQFVETEESAETDETVETAESVETEESVETAESAETEETVETEESIETEESAETDETAETEPSDMPVYALASSRAGTGVATVDGTSYASLQDAINAAAGRTVMLEQNVALEKPLSVYSGDVTLDLQGHLITGALSDSMLSVNGGASLTILDFSADGSGGIISETDSVVLCEGAVHMVDGKLESKADTGIYLEGEEASLKISGGSITGNTYGVFAYGGKVEMSGGSVTASTALPDSVAVALYGAYGSVSGTAKISGYNGIGLFNMDFTLNQPGNTANARPSVLEMSGGVINAQSCGVFGDVNMSAGCSAAVTGGTITASNTAVYWPMEGYLDIGGSAQLVGSTGLEAHMGTVNVTGGSIEGTGDCEADYGGSDATPDGSAIKLVGQMDYSKDQYIYSPDLSVSITDGIVSSSQGNAVSVYNNGTYATVEGIPVKTSISISDQVSMKSYTRMDNIRVISEERNYKLGDHSVTVGNMSISGGVCRDFRVLGMRPITVNGRPQSFWALYSSLSAAMTDSPQSSCNVSLLKDVDEEFTIPQLKFLYVDMNGKTLDGRIENRGELTLSGPGTLLAEVMGNPPTIIGEVLRGVAQVDGVLYPSLNAAVANANGKTVQLLRNTGFDRVDIQNMSVTVDLNGHTITANPNVSLAFVLQNGGLTLEDTSEAASGRLIVNEIPGKTDVAVVLNIGGSFIMNGGTIEAGDYGVFANPASGISMEMTGGKISANNGVAASGDGRPGCIHIKIGNGEITGKNTAVATNGSATRGGVVLEIGGGTLTATNPESTAVYLPGISGETTISGGVITGGTGVEIRSGSLKVSGTASISGTGVFSAQSNPSGGTTTGVGIAVAPHATMTPIDLIIEGDGAVIQGTYAFYEHRPEQASDEPSKLVTLDVSGGTYKSAPGNPALYSEDCTGFVSGGAFSSPVSQPLCVTGYTSSSVADANGFYTIVLKTITLTFDSAGGSAVAAITVPYGNMFAKPEAPMRPGYTFDGWYASGVDTPFDFENTKAEQDVTLTARWSLNPPQAAVTADKENPYAGDPVVLTAQASHEAQDVTLTYQWYKDDEAIAGAHEASYTADTDGKYTVVVTADVPGASAKAQASVDLHFTMYSQVVSFEKASVVCHVTDIGSTLTNTASVDVRAMGALAYESSDPAVAAVDAKSGLVTICSTGKATIYATAAGTETHLEGSASYEIVVTDHEYDAVVTAPTCTEDGYTTHTCSICKDSYKDSAVKAPGHTYEDGVCTVCGARDPAYEEPEESEETEETEETVETEETQETKETEETKESEKPGKIDGVQTGDPFMKGLSITVLVVSGLAIIAAALIYMKLSRRKKR